MTLKLNLVQQLDIIGGYYAFILPVAFYPDYRRYGVGAADAFPYQFSYQVDIIAKGRISNLSIPDMA